MPEFLDQIVCELKNIPEEEWKSIAFVFANRRSSLFFKERLVEQTQNTVWLPAFFTFESFLSHVTQLNILDETNLLFELYPVYHEFFPEDRFDVFWNWGKIMLQDFNEIDRYNRNVEDVLSNLEALREIDVQVESWEVEERDSFKSRFIWFWKSLKPLYKKFRKTLFDKKIAYKGLALKNALYDKQKIKNQTFKKIFFCGFHGFTPAEEAFIQAFGDQAKVIFDLDEWYLNPVHVAGKWFLKSAFVNSETEKPAQLKQKKDFYIIGTAQKQAQAKAIHELWKQLDLKENNTVVVLPDTSLLFPLLYAIPDEVQHVNITLGYPLSHSPIYGFLSSILQNMTESAKESMEMTEVLKVLRHPYSSHFFPDHIKLAQNLSEKYPGKIPYTQLLTELPENIHLLFQLYSDQSGISDLKKILISIRDFVRAEQDLGLEEEFLFTAYTLLTRLEDISIKYRTEWRLEEFILLFHEISRAFPIPFSGEPILGLQCMGFLETRCLDFETVIIPCMNAGTVPPETQQNTLIPFELRKRYGLSLPEHHEAEHSYYFYRLIQHAKTIILLKDAEEVPAERSPLIAQLEAEWKPLYPDHWHEHYWVPEIKNIQAKKVFIEKQEVWELLEQMAVSGFSPTRIQSYMQCPLKFGFQLLDFKEIDEKENDLDDADFGVLFHRLIEKLYLPLINHPEIQNLNLEKIITLARRKYKITEENFWLAFIESTFKELFENRTLDGKNVLACSVLEEQIKHLIINDLRKSRTNPFTILNMEKKWSCTLELKTGSIRTVKCKGFIDRVDEDEFSIRAIDYKTGNIQSLSYPDKEKLFSNESPKEAFQLMFYAWLMYQNGKTPPFQAAVYEVRKHQYHYLKKDGAAFSIYENDLKSFGSGLRKVIEEILHPGKALEQTDNHKHCKHCAYKNVCMR